MAVCGVSRVPPDRGGLEEAYFDFGILSVDEAGVRMEEY
jgi:hypothetical protein